MMIKLHLGCGKRFLEGYTHVDAISFPHVDRVGDVRDLSFLAPESVSEIYFCHGIEYFDRIEIGPVLQGWRRYMAPGAQLRLAVPDFARITELYRRSGDIEGPGILGPLYGRWENGKGGFSYHKTVYDERSLTGVLTANGFTGVRHWSPFEDFPPEYDDHSKAYVPHMDFENGTPVSLNLCAFKS